jgi:hypothetical protein
MISKIADVLAKNALIIKIQGYLMLHIALIPLFFCAMVKNYSPCGLECPTGNIRLSCRW